MQDQIVLILSLFVTFAATYFFVRYGWTALTVTLIRLDRWYDRVLNQQLLLEVQSNMAVGLTILGMVGAGMIGYLLLGNVLAIVFFAGLAAALPLLVVNHLESKRNSKLEEQLVDGITTLSSGVRAGLNIVQSFELLVTNSVGPIKQEFSQLLREYSMGLDLNHAMRNTANRVGLSSYRLLFTALEMHRKRGGQAAETLDRIADSIRDIQRLEGKLDALTAQGRYQAWGMAVMPIVILGILYLIDPESTALLFVTNGGRFLLLLITLLIFGGWYWIRRIMRVDI